MNTTLSLIRRHSFVTFVLLAYLLSWLVVVPTRGLLLPWGPMLAALIVVGLAEGKAGVKNWWKQVTQGGAGLRWVGLAVAIPVIIPLSAAALNILLGAPVPQHIDWSTPLRVLPMLLLVSGMWEEPGWTGYALPRLFKRFGTAPYGALVATLIVAAIRTGWHLPLMLHGHIYWTDIVLVIAAQIVFAWLFNRSRESVLVVMLCHLTNNLIAGEFVQQLFSGADWVRLYWLWAVLWGLLAVGVIVLAGPALARRTGSAPAEAARTSQSLP
jgi:hypothetical protein